MRRRYRSRALIAARDPFCAAFIPTECLTFFGGRAQIFAARRANMHSNQLASTDAAANAAKGVALQHPSWGGREIGFQPFPTAHDLKHHAVDTGLAKLACAMETK